MPSPFDRWTVSDADEMWEVSRWGQGYFSISEEGHLCAHPNKDPSTKIDLAELVDQLHLRGLQTPVIVRIRGILQQRLREIHDAFQSAIAEFQYQGRYSCVYPIKVNQQRQVVEEVHEFGKAFGFGLEAGSKPELLAVVAIADDQTPIICNGFKDVDFIETALMARKMGRNILIVVEKFNELGLILKIAERIQVQPQIGMRVKLSARGSGRWQGSGGDRSKFGLTISEVLAGLNQLQARGQADCFRLLHFHLGSQITNIRHVKSALVEAARIYADLYAQGAGLEYLDVGGGLGVDYDGSRTDFESSMNYTLEEYAKDVVYQVATVCNQTSTPHPNLITESGRAVSAYHSVLVFSVIGAVSRGECDLDENVQDDTPQQVKDLIETWSQINSRNAQESYHDAVQLRDQVRTLFLSGVTTLKQRARAEDFFWAICRKLHNVVQDLEFIPEELQGLERMLSDTYFCNFSVFQSLPDSWAIKQLFPIMPLHRLNERPTRNAVLGDITCDSDGKLDRFIDRRDVRHSLPLHAYDGAPYHLGAFLVGAYQEVLGDLHNLFGDPNVVHVDLNDQGRVVLTTIVRGQRVDQVLDYVQFRAASLLDQMQDAVEFAVQQGRLTPAEAGRFLRFYQNGLRAYTYLERTDHAAEHVATTPAKPNLADSPSSSADVGDALV